jgi:Flp/Fap pilin component
MKTSFIQFAGDESGVTAIEYGMICALIVISIVTGDRPEEIGRQGRADCFYDAGFT